MSYYETALEWSNRDQSSLTPKNGHVHDASLPNTNTENESLPCYLDGIWEDATQAFLCRPQIPRHRNNNNFQNNMTFLQKGTNIRFIDEALRSKNMNEDGNVVIEIMGGQSMGKTALVTSLVSSYIAATSQFIANSNNGNDPNSSTVKTQQPQPHVFLLDSDYGIQSCNLFTQMQNALLRLHHQHQTVVAMGPGNNSTSNSSTKEVSDFLQKEIIHCLSRIHITYPRDFGVGYVSMMEQIRFLLGEVRLEYSCPPKGDRNYNRDNQSLFKTLGLPFNIFDSSWNPDNANEGEHNQQLNSPLQYSQQRNHDPRTSNNMTPSSPPIMIIVDSLSSFERHDRMLEELNNTQTNSGKKEQKNGLSGKKDFLRQLQRLLQSQPRNIIVIVTNSNTSTFLNSHHNLTINNSDSNQANNTNISNQGNGGGDLWSKMVTHQILLRKTKPNTQEYNQGYEFVALDESNHYTPFNVTQHGISCMPSLLSEPPPLNRVNNNTSNQNTRTIGMY